MLIRLKMSSCACRQNESGHRDQIFTGCCPIQQFNNLVIYFTQVKLRLVAENQKSKRHWPQIKSDERSLSGMIETKSFCLERRANLIEFDNSMIMGLTIADPYPLTTPLKRYIFYTMTFTFDVDKSLANLSKHGIDFGEAQTLWNDPDLLEIPAKTVEEPRHLIIGKSAHKHWSAVIIYRDQYIRILSVRRSRPEEINLYES
ncbi:MAG: BrnT family toxin [Desulfuromonadales bacterium]|nr:BrnT family toxin [Desulfuromonadales bacterium]